MSEDKLKRKCVSWLKKEHPDVWFYCPTDHFYSGIPDFIICNKGKFIAVELKTPTGKTTKIQDWTHERIKKSGGIVYVFRSFDVFKIFISSL